MVLVLYCVLLCLHSVLNFVNTEGCREILNMLPKGLDRFTVGELRKMCEDRGLPTEGLIKGQLIEQLRAAEGIAKMQEELKAELQAASPKPKSPKGGLGTPLKPEGKDQATGMKTSTPKVEGKGTPKTGDNLLHGNESEFMTNLEIRKLE